VPEIPIWFSLLFIAATVAVATWLSLRKTRNDAQKADRTTFDDEKVIHAPED
jgi:tellurite resistance protein TerC